MESSRELNHKIWAIAGPAILSNISIPLLGLVDAAILGHLGDTRYLGAVALGSALLSFLYWGFSFLRMGTTGLVARAAGAGNFAMANQVLAQSAVLALVLALVVAALHPLWLHLGFLAMDPQPALQPLAASYVSIRIASAPAVLVTYAIVGWFIGQQNTRWPMWIVITTNTVNIGLDFVLVIGLGLNSDGAALATVIAEYLGCALALWAVYHQYRNNPHPIDWLALKQLAAYTDLLRSNRHLFVRTVCLLFSFAFFTAAGDKFGVDTLAANSLLMHLLMFASYGMDGFAYAAEGLAGNRLGGRDQAGFYRAVKRCAQWCAVTAVAVSAILALGHQPLFSLLTGLPAVHHLMTDYLWWLVVLPMIAAPSYLLDGVFIGAAETRPMMLTMLISTGLVYLPLWWLTRHWGNHGLWLAFTAFNACRGVSLFLVYRRYTRHNLWLPQPAQVRAAT